VVGLFFAGGMLVLFVGLLGWALCFVAWLAAAVDTVAASRLPRTSPLPNKKRTVLAWIGFCIVATLIEWDQPPRGQVVVVRVPTEKT
jgi:hypothetical protein